MNQRIPYLFLFQTRLCLLTEKMKGNMVSKYSTQGQIIISNFILNGCQQHPPIVKNFALPAIRARPVSVRASDNLFYFYLCLQFEHIVSMRISNYFHICTAGLSTVLYLLYVQRSLPMGAFEEGSTISTAPGDHWQNFTLVLQWIRIQPPSENKNINLDIWNWFQAYN